MSAFTSEGLTVKKIAVWVHMGDAVTGGTVYWLSDSVDAGPIAARWSTVFIFPGEAPERVSRDKLARSASGGPCGCSKDLAAGQIVSRRQDKEAATWEPSWTRPPLPGQTST